MPRLDGEGGFLLTARAQGLVPSHAHHAIQIVIALDGCVAICGQDFGWRESRGTIVRPDAEHSFDCNGALRVMVFVDPESSEGAWLSTSLRQGITDVPDARLDPLCRTCARSPNDQMRVRTSRHSSCAVCPGSECKCGCQNPAARPAPSCQCGEVCHCGPTCSCKGCQHANAREMAH